MYFVCLFSADIPRTIAKIRFNFKNTILHSKNRLRRIYKSHRFKIVAILLILLIWLFCLPAELFNTPTSTVVNSREGNLLGARIAEDEQWRFPEMDSVPYHFEQAILLFEDEYFYKHPGFNPVSTVKAFWQNLTTEKRRGGSTLTQQVMRLAHKNNKRTYLEKFIETFQATRLEVRYSKDKILKLYTSHAPFGSNVVGLPAASWRYFGIPPDELSWGQATALAVLPNAPSLIFPGKNEEALKAKRDVLLKKLFDKKIIDRTTYELALAEPLPNKPLKLPDLAPHFTEKIRKENQTKIFTSSINYHLQRKINQIVNNHYDVLKTNQIHNMAVLILDIESRKVLAYVGNTPSGFGNNGYVDIISKPRSTGSVLKPFLYAAMLDAGDILPNTLISDVPTNIDGYSPKNYQKNYLGAVPANKALTKSLNVPFVGMLKEYGLDRFAKLIKKINQKHINKPAEYYGLPMIVGGAESSLWDVTKAYAGMASILNNYQVTSSEYFSNEFVNPVYADDSEVKIGKIQHSTPVFGAGSIYQTLQALRELNRPIGAANWEVFDNAQPIAWKTGTSYGFKDAWAVGTTSQYAIGVWVGNADGEGRPGLVGIEAAAPVFFDVLTELPKSNWFSPPYDDMVQVNICKQSGQLAGVYCDDATQEWIPKKGTKTETCHYHHRVFLDETEQYQVNSSCYSLSEMVVKNWFSLPPVEEFYYKQQHPNYNILPPYKSDCLQDGQSLMAFIYPKPNESIILPKDFDEEVNEVIFKLAHRGKTTKIYWYLDESYLGQTDEFHEISVKPSPGKYILTAIDQEGNEIKERIRVKQR